MRTKILFITAISLLITLAGCKKDEKKDPVSLSEKTETIVGSTGKPTWSVPDKYDMTVSMTAVVAIDLSCVYTDDQLTAARYALTENDLVAAFSGEICLGVASPQRLETGYYFFMYICPPADGETITIRYYSSRLKHIYTAEKVQYVNDGQLGTAGSPYMPVFDKNNIQ